MTSSREVRVLIVVVLALIAVTGVVYWLSNSTSFEKLWANSERILYTRIIPSSEKITIISRTSEYRVAPETDEFVKNIANELNLFEELGVTRHFRTSTQKRTIRELDVVFTDTEQYWPLMVTGEGIITSSFDFDVDHTNKGTLYLWINPTYAPDGDRLSRIVNKSFFMALYVLTHWETYMDNYDEYNVFLGRVDNQMSGLSSEERSLKVIN